MPVDIVRFEHEGKPRWGVRSKGRVHEVAGDFATTGDLITHGDAAWRAAASATDEGLDGSGLAYLSPVTAPCRVLCQGANYVEHMRSSGMDPDAKTFNMFFEKSDASIAPPIGSVTTPSHVKLLDYEIELGLVFKKPITSDTVVTDANLHEFIFGITIANDISARDVQLPQTQFFKGKSYRGFCPLGPTLVALDAEDFTSLHDLELTLSVNGKVRQKDNTRNLVFKPAESITELSTFSDLSPGDILLTGTPDGCALKAPKPAVRRVIQLLPDKALWKLFVRSQSQRPQYLHGGDVMTLTIASPDRRIDLGEQRTTVIGPARTPPSKAKKTTKSKKR